VSAWRDSDLFDERERAALELAEAMTFTPANVSDAVFDEARRHFSEDELVELVASIAMENYRARFNRAFAIESTHRYHGELTENA
jgi:alkylhydroperoxidase family enzyme